MKITISVHQKYHAFRLAEGLDEYGVLKQLHTVYPKRIRVGAYKTPNAIPTNKIKGYSLIGIFRYLVSRKMNFKFLDEMAVRFFDFRVSRNLKLPSEDKEIFHGWNASCLQSLKRAKRLGYITVVERSCPHTDEQGKLIREEKARLLGKNINDFYPTRIEKIVRDYEVKEYEVADYIVTPSFYTKKGFLDRGFNPKKVIAIPLSLEKQTKFPDTERSFSKGFKVLFVGGDFYRKGLYYLIKAWRSLNLEDAELIVKGKVPKEFARMRETNNVRFIDHYLSEEELKGLYSESHLFVLPSIDEGFGMVVAEAMTAGLPVIVTENVGAADYIQDGVEGFVVPIRNPEVLAKKMRFFYDNPEETKKMGLAALKKSKFFTPDAYVKRMVKAYMKM